MSLNVMNAKINVDNVIELAKTQYKEKLLLSGICKAGKETFLKTSVSSLGPFISEAITGSFTTLEDDGGNVVDKGINYLRLKFVDGTNQRQLSNDYIPADLLFSLGRVRAPEATNNDTTAPAPSNLFYPYEFAYPFDVNSEIGVYVKNDSDVDQELNICFHGVRIVTA